MASVEIKFLDTLPSEGGESLAFDGDRLAVAGSTRLCVWRGDTRVATIEAELKAPGVPRFAGERVYWGPGFADLVTGYYTRLEGERPIMWPGGGEVPQVYAWSPRGERLVGSFARSELGHSVRVTLYHGETGEPLATLYEGSGLPPLAAWLGKSACVVGFNNPRVFDHSGRHLADITLGGPTVSCIEAITSERRLIAVELNNAMTLIDAATWTVLDRWPGPWLHGTVSPDGRFVAVLEPWGKLHFACLEDDRFRPAGEVAIDREAISVALSLAEIATVGGGEVRRASPTVDCTTV